MRSIAGVTRLPTRPLAAGDPAQSAARAPPRNTRLRDFDAVLIDFPLCFRLLSMRKGALRAQISLALERASRARVTARRATSRAGVLVTPATVSLSFLPVGPEGVQI